MDLGIFQYTMLTGRVYTCGSAGYSVVAKDSLSQHRGGVAVFYRPSLPYAVESIQQFRPNIVVFSLVTGERQWYIIGCYLTPDKTSTMDSVAVVLKECPRGS